MKMRMRMGLTLALVLGVGAAGWGEALALTVHHQYADPGEEGVEWTKEFYLDDQGRLARVHTLRQGGSEGSTREAKDLVVQWNGNSGVWNESTEISVGKGQLDLSTGALRLTLTGSDGSQWKTDYRWVSPFQGAWTDGQYRYSWSLEHGYQAVLDPNGVRQASLHSPSEWVTQGSRLVTLREGKTWEFLLLNRTPRFLEGTYYGNYLEDQGWIAVGKTTLIGNGLWSTEETKRLANAVLLSLEVPGNLWPAFVFVQNYLK